MAVRTDLVKAASPYLSAQVHSESYCHQMRRRSKSRRPCRSLRHRHIRQWSRLACRQIYCRNAQRGLRRCTDLREGDRTPAARTGCANFVDGANPAAATGASGWKGCRSTCRSSWWQMITRGSRRAAAQMSRRAHAHRVPAFFSFAAVVLLPSNLLPRAQLVLCEARGVRGRVSWPGDQLDLRGRKRRESCPRCRKVVMREGDKERAHGPTPGQLPARGCRKERA